MGVFSSLRVVLVAVTLVVLLAGTLIGTSLINATSTGAGSNPTSPAAMALATRSLPRSWVVQKGDTFTSIAASNHLSVAQLQQLNPTQDPSILLSGQRLRLHLTAPRAPIHRRAPRRFWIVRAGQTFTTIAARTGVQVSDIAQLNPATNPNLLRPGTRLRLR